MIAGPETLASLAEDQPGVAGAAAHGLELEVIVVLPGDLADHRVVLALGQGQDVVPVGDTLPWIGRLLPCSVTFHSNLPSAPSGELDGRARGGAGLPGSHEIAFLRRPGGVARRVRPRPGPGAGAAASAVGLADSHP